MGKIFLVVPDAPAEDAAELKASRALSSAGIRMGVLDNTKGNADHLLNFIVEGVKKEFKVDEGETTEDMSLTLETVGCVGCCGLAPVITVNEEVVGEITEEKFEDIAKQIRSSK